MKLTLTARLLHIPFRGAFAHASARRDQTSTLWVEASDEAGNIGLGEGCPRPYVSGETEATAQALFARWSGGLEQQVRDLDGLRRWAVAHARDIDANPAAWCAIELALLDLFARRDGVSAETLLGLPAPAPRPRYTAVLGDDSPQAFVARLEQYRAAGFEDYKIKLGGDPARDRAKVEALRAAGIETARADANNRWRDPDEAARYLRALDYPFSAIEEPLAPRAWRGLADLHARLGAPVILDESLLRPEHLDALPPRTQIANLRVSKLGGLLRALDCASAASVRGIPIILGAQVGETSVLARAALTLGAGLPNGAMAREGAFGTWLLERDAATPELRVGAGGVLDVEASGVLAAPGFGLSGSFT
jgi:L-alanine-DL-glutamate epimerase-like enolase superfamily enzyme